MAKCNEIISKMMLYDNDDEHKGNNVDSEVNLHYKHPVLQYNTHHMHFGHYYYWHNKNYKKNKGIIGDDMGII